MSSDTPEKKIGPAGGNIFIKNLDKSIDDDGLQDIFSKFGVILSCKVALDQNGVSKGHGFIQFEDEESAKTAILKRNGITLRDKKMYVGRFIARKDREQSQQFQVDMSSPPAPMPMPSTVSNGIVNYKPVGLFWDIENCSVPKNKSACALIAHIRNVFVLNRLNHREYEFMIACDVTRVPKGIRDDVNKAGGVTQAHVDGTSKNAADEKLRDSMKRFVDTHNASSPMLVLISSDIDFVNDLRGYQVRMGCAIVLVHALNCSPQFKLGWNEIYSFQDFCLAVPETQRGANGPTYNTANNTQPRDRILGPVPRQHGPIRQQLQRPYGPHNPQFHHRANYAQLQRDPQNAQFRQPLKSLLDFTGGPPIQNHPNTGRGSSRQGQGNRRPRPGQEQPMSSTPPSVAQMRQLNIQDPAAKEEYILMVAGLPGKMDFHILKNHLQEQANAVHGKVKYVKNGQGFISFNNKSNAERAVHLFHGKEVFGKTLNVSTVQSIPFESQRISEDQRRQEESDESDESPEEKQDDCLIQ